MVEGAGRLPMKRRVLGALDAGVLAGVGSRRARGVRADALGRRVEADRSQVNAAEGGGWTGVDREVRGGRREVGLQSSRILVIIAREGRRTRVDRRDVAEGERVVTRERVVEDTPRVDPGHVGAEVRDVEGDLVDAGGVGHTPRVEEVHIRGFIRGADVRRFGEGRRTLLLGTRDTRRRHSTDDCNGDRKDRSREDFFHSACCFFQWSSVGSITLPVGVLKNTLTLL